VNGTRPPAETPVLPLWRRLAALAGAGACATLILAILDRWGLHLGSFLGLQVGGYLLAWFGVAGLAAVILLRAGGSPGPGPGHGWGWLAIPSWRTLVSGLLVAAFLWAGMGLLAGQVVLPWLLIPPRLLVYPLAVICLLPWSLAVGQVTSPARPAGRAGWWLVHSLVMLLSLLWAIRLSPELFFLGLILPVFPLVLAAHAIAAGKQAHPWPYAISSALFLGWVVMAVFPLVG
jgi:hypothetical protein